MRDFPEETQLIEPSNRPSDPRTRRRVHYAGFMGSILLMHLSMTSASVWIYWRWHERLMMTWPVAICLAALTGVAVVAGIAAWSLRRRPSVDTERDLTGLAPLTPGGAKEIDRIVATRLGFLVVVSLSIGVGFAAAEQIPVQGFKFLGLLVAFSPIAWVPSALRQLSEVRGGPTTRPENTNESH